LQSWASSFAGVESRRGFPTEVKRNTAGLQELQCAEQSMDERTPTVTVRSGDTKPERNVETRFTGMVGELTTHLSTGRPGAIPQTMRNRL
jgi:hypothetical protein